MYYRILLLIALSWPCVAYTQVLPVAADITMRHVKDSLVQNAQKVPSKYFKAVNNKVTDVDRQIKSGTEKLLNKFIKQDERLRKKLFNKDSIAAKETFDRSLSRLKELKANLKAKVPGMLPIGGNLSLDSLENSLTFLQGSKALVAGADAKLKDAVSSVRNLSSSMQKADEVKAYIREHQKALKDKLQSYTGFTKDLQKMNGQFYYYGQQMNEYKALLKDKKKAEAKAMGMLKKLPAYNDFMRKHSQWASLLKLYTPGNAARILDVQQTDDEVIALLLKNYGSIPDVQQNVSQALSAASLFKKVPDLDNGGDMPDFKPNDMKAKRFLQRLEFGGNIQFQKASKYFPTYAELAGQVAYKFHKNGSAGFGVAYKLGLGSSWSHIAFSHQGLGFRSFADWKLKGSFYVNGGFEENVQSTFSNLDQLRNRNVWKGSALLGASKKFKVSAKLKGNVMVLYDFLAKGKLPTDRIKFRLGYNF